LLLCQWHFVSAIHFLDIRPVKWAPLSWVHWCTWMKKLLITSWCLSSITLLIYSRSPTLHGKLNYKVYAAFRSHVFSHPLMALHAIKISKCFIISAIPISSFTCSLHLVLAIPIDHLFTHFWHTQTDYFVAIFEIIIAVKIYVKVFWFVTPCIVVLLALASLFFFYQLWILCRKWTISCKTHTSNNYYV